MSVTILGIESSCDDTSAAVLRDEYLLSNVMASQEVHRQNGAWILIRAANIAEKLRIYIESPNREFLEEVENDLMQEPENLLAGNFHRKD